MPRMGPIRNRALGAAKFVATDRAADLVDDHATVAIAGSGGGLLEPDDLLSAIERRFLRSGSPRGLTIVHSQGLGDMGEKGLNRLAHEGLVKRVLGAHWAWSPRMQQLAADNKIEAYALPGGVVQHLVREIGAGRPGLVTPVGLHTMVDPRQRGGRMNSRASEPICELVSVDDREYIRYFPFRLDVAILRGTRADVRGNVSFDEEGAELDAFVLSIAAHNCEGRVLVQVRQRVGAGQLRARSVRVPAALVDAIVVTPSQEQSHSGDLGIAITGHVPRGDGPRPQNITAVGWSPERLIIATRARRELADGAVVSLGLGMPDGILNLPTAEADLSRCYQTLDHGHHGGRPAQGALFGFVYDGEALIDSPSQFDFYSGGGIDIAFLGFGELDGFGNVNVSRLGGRIVGPGGFIDISQSAKKVVFCGTFEAKGLKLAVSDGKVSIQDQGTVPKLVDSVSEITFSGRRALELGQEVIYVTERAVFRLTAGGLELIELMPGIDLQRDVLDRMQFVPLIREGGPCVMPGTEFLSLLSAK